MQLFSTFNHNNRLLMSDFVNPIHKRKQLRHPSPSKRIWLIFNNLIIYKRSNFPHFKQRFSMTFPVILQWLIDNEF